MDFFLVKDKKICILNYGSGNVSSVANVIRYLGFDVVISNDKNDIENSTHLILPGVGAFGSSMRKIISNIPMDTLEKEILINCKPFLGICVGMQVLADKGFEFGEFAGLGWIPGIVKKLDSKNLPLPHIGWNNISVKNKHKILDGFYKNPDFYFVNSFVYECTEINNVIAETEYGLTFPSIINKNNIFGVQFHPEKSQKTGQLLFKNFIEFV